MLNLNQKKIRTLLVLQASICVIAIAIAGQGCKKGKGLTPRGVSVQFEVLTVQGKISTEWKVDLNKKVYINSRSLDVGGTCLYPSTYEVKINNVKEPQVITCLESGKFKWVRTFDADADYSLNITSTKDSTQTFSSVVVVDTIPPPAPVITTNGGVNFISSTPNYSIAGTVTSDVNAIRASFGTALLSSPTTFSYNSSLNWGETRTVGFRAEDFAGNLSTEASITVSYNSSNSLRSYSFSSLRALPEHRETGTTALMEASGSNSVQDKNTIPSTGLGAIQLQTGFTNIGNSPD